MIWTVVSIINKYVSLMQAVKWRSCEYQFLSLCFDPTWNQTELIISETNCFTHSPSELLRIVVAKQLNNQYSRYRGGLAVSGALANLTMGLPFAKSSESFKAEMSNLNSSTFFIL